MKKKGFTLVELLATIVVLSVIALIAVPIVINVIEKAKKGALVSSVNGLVESANMYYTNEIIKGDIKDKVIFDFEEGIQTSENQLSYKGRVYNGKLILTSDSDVITCIDDGKYYAYKEKDSDEIISGVGTCVYDGTTGDFTIESDVDVVRKECESDKEELLKQIEELTNNVNSLQTIINEKEYEISNLRATIDNLNNEITVLTGEKEELIRQLELANTGNEELRNKITELEGIIDALKSSLEAKENEITVLTGEKEELENALETKTNELKEINENLGKVTAGASDVLTGKTILTSSGLVTGTMPNTDSNIAAKQYLWTGIQFNEYNTWLVSWIPSAYYRGWQPLNGKLYAETFIRQNDLANAIGLTANKLLKGQTVLGVEGIATNDATASASQILSGQTAYVNGSKITGSMSNKSGSTVSASTVTKSGSNALITIPSSGYYSTSSKISVPIETVESIAGGNIYYLGSVNNSKTLDVKSKLPNDYANLTVDNFIVMPTNIGWAQGRNEQGSSAGKWKISYNATTGVLTVGASYSVPSGDGGGTHGIAYTTGNKVYCVIGSIKSL